MNFFFKFLVFIPVILLSACDKGEAKRAGDFIPSTDITDFYVRHDTNEFKLQFASNTTWSTKSDSEWLSVRPSFGRGDGEFTLTFADNAGDKERRGRVTVTYEGGSYRFHITQYSLSNILFLADPYILEDNGIFYLYGTSSYYTSDGIVVFQSSDMRTWRGPCGKAAGGMALHKDDVWGTEKFWAPEVYKVNGKYYFAYSGEERVCLAESDSPLGPFRCAITNNGNMSPYFPSEFGIDNHIFTDDDGKSYMYWVRSASGSTIFCAELSGDLTSIVSDKIECVRAEAGTWEREMGRIAEGPFVVKHKGTYYLTFSCNDYQHPGYGVGYATSSSPTGPWTKAEENPILRYHGGFNGTGHHSILKTSAGEYFIVFHAHYKDDSRPEKIHPRHVLISRMNFVDNGSQPDRIEVDNEIWLPGMKL